MFAAAASQHNFELADLGCLPCKISNACLFKLAPQHIATRLSRLMSLQGFMTLYYCEPSSAKAPSIVTLVRDVTEEPSRITRIF
jgi:hypothetical protein